MKKSFFSKTQKYLFLGLAVVVLAICIISVKYYASSAATLNTIGSNPISALFATHNSTSIDDYSDGAYMTVNFKVDGSFDTATLSIGGAKRSVPISFLDSKVDFSGAKGTWQYGSQTKILGVSIPLAKLRQTLSAYPGMIDNIGQYGMLTPNNYILTLCKGTTCSKFNLPVNSLSHVRFQ